MAFRAAVRLIVDLRATGRTFHACFLLVLEMLSLQYDCRPIAHVRNDVE